MGKHKPPEKMPRCERAKQFMPFSALKGLEEALAEKEKIVLPKKELAEDAIEILNRRLNLLQKKRTVRLLYFCDGEYRCINGQAQLNQAAAVLAIGTEKIALEDILAIEIIG